MAEGEVSGERQFAEEVGLLFERFGLSRMGGRILGWLLICDPPRQSSTDLAVALGASKGSISTATRFLISAGMIERSPVPGARGHFFEITPETFVRANDQLGTFRLFQDLMNKGLAVLGDERSPRAKRLRRTRDLYAFLEREYPKLVERFEAEYPE